MGYYVSMRAAYFFIAAEKKAAALQATKELANQVNEGRGGSYPVERKWFSWMNGTPFDSGYVGPFYATLEEVFVAWGYPVETDDAGNIVDICFEGEKLGQEKYLFHAIAPYVEADSFIEMEGEDGFVWRWRFQHGRMSEQVGRIVFD